MGIVEILALLNTLADISARAADAYQKMRETAKEAGATDEDLALADERFQRIYEDPLNRV